jgi:PhoH-like ATPase
MKIDISQLHKYRCKIVTDSGLQEVVDTFEKYEDSYELIFADGTILSVAHNHLFETLNGDWVFAKDLNEKIPILRENGIVYLLQKRFLGKEKVYDLEVNSLKHQYYLDGISSHNSGKTLLTLSSAISLVKRKEYSRIVYIRNSIESLDKGEEVGFLSGNSEKFAIYNHPLYDSLDFILREKSRVSNSNRKGVNKESEAKISEERMGEIIEQYGIETMWVGELRGRTIHDAFVIIDEAQNISDKTMKTILTRVADDCKVVIIGSLRQIDNIYLNKHTSSLTRLLSKMDKKFDTVNVYAVELNKVVRGKITEWAESEIFND